MNSTESIQCIDYAKSVLGVGYALLSYKGKESDKCD
jgi:hypothetical protein